MPLFRRTPKLIKTLVVLALFAVPIAAVGAIAWNLQRTATLAPQSSQASARKYERWFHPNFINGLGTISWAGDFKNEAAWAEVLPKIDVFSLFFDTVRRNPENFLADFLPILKKYNVALAIETYGSWEYTACNDQRGESAAAIQLATFKKIYDNGGEIAYLSLDDPLYKTIAGSRWATTCNFTTEQAATEMIDYMQAVHAVYPKIKIGLITNFPNWRYGADGKPYTHNQAGNKDYREVLRTTVEMVNQRGEKLEFLHADNPYDYTTGAHPAADSAYVRSIDWLRRMLDLENQARELGLKFGPLYNSERGGNNKTSDEQFYADTTNFIRDYFIKGGRPEHVMVESWYVRPAVLLPAGQPHSTAYTALKSFELYDSLIDPASAPSQTVYQLTRPDGWILLTISENESQSAIAQHRYQSPRPAFRAWAKTGPPGLQPVYRLQKAGSGYAFAINEKERNRLVNSGWTAEGIAFFASTKATALTPTRVYKLSRKTAAKIPQFIYTASTIERRALVESKEYSGGGVAFYVAAQD